VEDPLNRDRFLAKQIIDGAITLDSVSDFQAILQQFPENSSLHAAYADLLVRRKRFDTAAESYGRAADLFLAEGRLLPATVYRVLQWRLNKPARDAALDFYETLCESGVFQPPVNGFLIELSFREWVAFTNRIARQRVDPHQKIKKIGDTENALYLIVSGVVRDTRILPLQGEAAESRKVSRYLSENDFFGNLFPLDEEHISASYTESLTAVELAVISRRRLREVCRKYPGLKRALVSLVENSGAETQKPARNHSRASGRQLLPIRIRVERIDDGKAREGWDGFTRDISIGGVCAIIDAAGEPSLFARDETVRVRFLGGPVSLDVEGRVAWSRPVETARGKNTPALGIQFRNLTPKIAGLLMVFADMFYQPLQKDDPGRDPGFNRDNRSRK